MTPDTKNKTLRYWYITSTIINYVLTNNCFILTVRSLPNLIDVCMCTCIYIYNDIGISIYFDNIINYNREWNSPEWYSLGARVR